MASGVTQTADDKKWQAEEDGRTLMRAQEVRGDPKRLKMAIKQLKEQRDDAAEALALETKTTARLKAAFSSPDEEKTR